MTWNITRGTRKEIIVIAKILEQWSEYAADFPGMKILDKNGKEHIFSYIDLGISMKDWDKIKVGSKIELTVTEKVERATLL